IGKAAMRDREPAGASCAAYIGSIFARRRYSAQFFTSCSCLAFVWAGVAIRISTPLFAKNFAVSGIPAISANQPSSLSVAAVGVPAGTSTDHHTDTSMPGIPPSPIVGTPGINLARRAVDNAKARHGPLLTCPSV